MRRWVAPWTGTVQIDATATLLTPPHGEGLADQSVGLTVQHNQRGGASTDISTTTLDVVGES